MKLEVVAELFREGSYIVAYVKALDLSSCGKTETEAVQALIEAVRLFLVTSLEIGTLDQVLINSGYVRHGDEWAGPTETEKGWAPDNMIPVTDVTRRFTCVEI